MYKRQDEELIREYIQHPKIAEDFSAYLDLYYKYRDDYGVDVYKRQFLGCVVYKRQLYFKHGCPSGVRYKQVAIR